MAKQAKQLSFEGIGLRKPLPAFGGKLLKGNPKIKRPMDSKLPLHLCLRANQGGLRLPKLFGKVDEIIWGTAKKYGVSIFKSANVGNHLHLVIRVKNKRLWAAFIRELTGRIAQICIELGVVVKGESFWMYRPFTRIISGWKMAFEIAKEYVYLNQLEAEGFISRKDTRKLKDLRAIFDG